MALVYINEPFEYAGTFPAIEDIWPRGGRFDNNMPVDVDGGPQGLHSWRLRAQAGAGNGRRYLVDVDKVAPSLATKGVMGMWYGPHQTNNMPSGNREHGMFALTSDVELDNAQQRADDLLVVTPSIIAATGLYNNLRPAHITGDPLGHNHLTNFNLSPLKISCLRRNFWEMRYEVLNDGDDIRIEVRINRVPLLDETFSNPFPGPIYSIGLAGWRDGSAGSLIFNSPIHGFYIDTEDFLGPIIVRGMRPDSQGHYNDWSATDTNKVADLASVPPGEEGATGGPGDRDTYEMGTYTRLDPASPIHGVDVTVVGDSASPTDTQVAALLRRGSADEQAADLLEPPFISEPRHNQQFYRLDPFTDEPWVEANINDTEFGVIGVDPNA